MVQSLQSEKSGRASATPKRFGQPTFSPTRNLTVCFDEYEHKPRFLLRDHHTQYVKEFDEILQAEGIEVKSVNPKDPNLKA